MIWIYNVARLILAVVFVLASAMKWFWFEEFVFTTGRLFAIVGIDVEPQLWARLLIGAEILIGVCFALNVRAQTLSLVTAGLLIMFIGVQIVLFVNAESCGCFGGLSREAVSLIDIARNFGLIGLCIVVYRLHDAIKKPKAVLTFGM
jgi:uncharacterized membrane protein YphA (DoxX/SURF4 family)